MLILAHADRSGTSPMRRGRMTTWPTLVSGTPGSASHVSSSSSLRQGSPAAAEIEHLTGPWGACPRSLDFPGGLASFPRSALCSCCSACTCRSGIPRAGLERSPGHVQTPRPDGGDELKETVRNEGRELPSHRAGLYIAGPLLYECRSALTPFRTSRHVGNPLFAIWY